MEGYTSMDEIGMTAGERYARAIEHRARIAKVKEFLLVIVTAGIFWGVIFSLV